MNGGVPTVQAKRLLTPVHGSESGFFYTDYTMNLYHGCNHGCVYCDTRSVCYHMDDFDTVRVKADALRMLEDELRRKRRPGVVGMGAATDPYNALEKRIGVTRGALLLLRRYGFGVGIPTKSALVARDADVLAEISRHAPVRVSFSITTADDSLARQIEPGAPGPGERQARPVISLEGRWALMKPRVSLTPAIQAERRRRGVATAVCATVCATGAGVAGAYLLDAAHFASRDLESVMGAMLAHTAPWMALSFAALMALAQLRQASIRREIAAMKAAPKREPDPRPARRREMAPAGRIALLVCAVMLVIAGIINGGMYDVLVKAINICTECIGLG